MSEASARESLDERIGTAEATARTRSPISVQWHRLRRRAPGLAAPLLYAGERLIATVIAVGVFVVLARCYAPAALGVWTYATAVVQLAAPFLASGIEPVIVRALVRDPSRRARILGSAAVVVAGASVLAVLAPLAYVAAAQGTDAPAAQIALVAALAFAPNFLLVTEHVLRVDGRAVAIVAARGASVVFGSTAKVALALHGESVATLAIVLPLEALLHATLLGLAARSSAPITGWRFDAALARAIVRAGAPLVAGALLVTLFFRANYFLLAGRADFAQTGYYALAFNVVVVASTAPNMILTGLFPRLVELARDDRARFDRIVGRLFLFAAAGGYAMVAGAWLLAPWVVPAIFGARYAPAVGAIVVATLACVFIASGSVRACVINVDGRFHYHALSALAGLAALIPVAWWAIPQWGATGAAWAIAAGALASAVLSSSLFPALRPYARCQILSLLLIASEPKPARVARA